ncbi:hypothetical protein Srufu_013680 [Streptomyces libani subsp. rufus]|nr:hypothetical protein Srufu_013680 [Streptomyces libani subsp. rufus]
MGLVRGVRRNLAVLRLAVLDGAVQGSGGDAGAATEVQQRGTLRGRCLSAAYVVLFVGALISIVRARMDGGMKLVWLVFAFVAPFLGSLLWLLIGRRRLTPRQNT